MADDRSDASRSMRTPLARVKGLGASGHGAEHWWLQRLTAVANIPLLVAFTILIVNLSGRTYGEAAGIVSRPFVAIVLALAVISVTTHMRIGMQVIIEDYVHDKGLKIASLVANTFYAVVIAVACLYAILKVSVGGIL
jgi:succinate dehydrogenase / fumarate reductase membrane anchor subunit